MKLSNLFAVIIAFFAISTLASCERCIECTFTETVDGNTTTNTTEECATGRAYDDLKNQYEAAGWNCTEK